VITTGTFDGVHKGHLHIINRLNALARECNGESVIFTFVEHPRIVLHPNDHGLSLLQTNEEKIERLSDAGIQHLVFHPFTKEFSRLSALEYVRNVLMGQMNVHKMVVGYDHHFGRNREGTFEVLSELADTFGFDVEEIPAKVVSDSAVSSTKIRAALAQGEVEKAGVLLGYTYSISGIVVRGRQLGRKFGFPTANIVVSHLWKLIPANGVYAVSCTINGQIDALGMLNIGHNPTTGINNPRSIELHIFDWNENIYDQNVTLRFVSRIREEIKFSSMEALKEQLILDRQKSISILT
jgi:riboflavin kinase / FMN adenylyltransferase